jgi:hypothetical protein
MQILVGDWWTMDDRGEGPAHRVGVILPDLTMAAVPRIITYDHSDWIPLCDCGPCHKGKRRESATLFSSFVPDSADARRCSTCEVMSPALDRWLESHFDPRDRRSPRT